MFVSLSLNSFSNQHFFSSTWVVGFESENSYGTLALNKTTWLDKSDCMVLLFNNSSKTLTNH